MAESILDIIFRTKKEGTGEEQAKSGLSGLNSAFTDLTGVSLTGMGAIMAVGGALKYSIDAAAEAEQIQRQLNQVLSSTGGAAGMTADDINGMATNLSNLSAVEDDAIVKASSVMLTFTSIGKEAFPAAMESALDLSAALGQDLQSSVIQIGKALNDPIQGVTALQRVGVSFTDSQKDMIETLQEGGDMLGAQQVVLAELNKEFGGQAAAAAETYAGKVKILQNNLGNLAEEIGGFLLPWLIKATDTLNILIEWHNRVTGAVQEHTAAVTSEATTYEAYISEMIRVAEATGQMDENIYNNMVATQGQAEANRMAAEEMGFLSESTWEMVRSSQAADEHLSKMAGIYTTNAQAATQQAQSEEEIAKAEKEAEKAARNYEKAAKDLAGGFKDLEKAQQSWRQNAGADVKAELESGWMSSEKYKEAIKAIDETYGTSFENQENYKEDVKKLKAEYAQTGDIEKFKQGLKNLEKTYMENDERVIASRAKILEFKQALDTLPANKDILIHIKALIDIIPPDGGGGGGGGGCCFTSESRVNTPQGYRAIGELKEGDQVLVLNGSGLLEPAKITHVWHIERSDMLTVTTMRGTVLHPSPNHRFKVRGGEFVAAADLQPGMELVSTDRPAFVKAVEAYPGAYPVYDLSIDHEEHTYLVEGIVVHNKPLPNDFSALPSCGVGPVSTTSSASAAGGPVVNIGTVNINNGMDLEELKYHIRQAVGGE